MRYLIYTETFPSSASDSPRQTGIGRYCYDLALGLSEIGHDVTVLANHDENSRPGDGHLPFTVHRRGPYGPSWLSVIPRAMGLQREVVRVRPDILLLADPRAHSVFSILRYLCRIPYCTIFYGTDVNVLAETVRRQDRSPGKLFRRRLLVRYIQSADERICISRFTMQGLREVAGGEVSYFVLYPCVGEMVLTRPIHPASRVTSRAKQGGNDERCVGFITVGRISERKNQLKVLEILARLREREHLTFHYRIVGNLDAEEHDDYFRRVNDFIASNKLHSCVSIIRGATDEEKIEYLDASDIFIMLSQKVGNSVEGFGISAIEASCRGKPIVVSDHGGMPETVVHGKTGFAVPLRDESAVAGAIMRLARDKGMRWAMGEAGREYIRENFTPAIMARRLAEHLEERREEACNWQ